MEAFIIVDNEFKTLAEALNELVNEDWKINWINKIKCFLQLHEWDYHRDTLGKSYKTCMKCGKLVENIWDPLGKVIFYDVDH